MKKTTGILLTLLCSQMLCGADFLTAAKPEEFIGNGKAVFENGETTLNGSGTLYSKKKLDIDTKKRYRLSGEFKAHKNAKKGDFFRFGVYPSRKYSTFLATNIFIVPGSDTELKSDCKASDTVLRLKDASKWKGDTLSVVAFDTDPTGALSDLPNFNITRIGAISLVKKDGFWELTLKHPCGKNYPAGTTVREHRSGWSSIYAGTPKQELSGEWKKIDAVLEPGEVPEASIRRWWKGTEKAGLVLESVGSGMIFRNLKLEELPAK